MSLVLDESSPSHMPDRSLSWVTNSPNITSCFFNAGGIFWSPPKQPPAARWFNSRLPLVVIKIWRKPWSVAGTPFFTSDQNPAAVSGSTTASETKYGTRMLMGLEKEYWERDFVRVTLADVPQSLYWAIVERVTLISRSFISFSSKWNRLVVAMPFAPPQNCNLGTSGIKVGVL